MMVTSFDPVFEGRSLIARCHSQRKLSLSLTFSPSTSFLFGEHASSPRSMQMESRAGLKDDYKSWWPRSSPITNRNRSREGLGLVVIMRYSLGVVQTESKREREREKESEEEESNAHNVVNLPRP